MNIFPDITNLEEFKANVGDIPGIEFITVPGGYTIASYYILDSKVFQNPYARECRGITFDKNGDLVSRPLHKFFNLGERESTLEKNIDWSTLTTVMDKRDGSMISPVLLEDGSIKFKTKRSFTSDPAVLVNNTFGPDSAQYKMSQRLCSIGCTPIFEITSPNNRIVVSYKETELVLLAVRKNQSGNYFSRDQLELLASEWNIPIVDTFTDVTISDLKHSAETQTGIEGWVVQFNTGEMIKLKTAWYLSLHGSVTFTTEKNIAEMVIDETIDDFKSYCTSVGDTELFDKVVAIETRVNNTLSEIIDDVNRTVETCGIEQGQFKEFALTYTDHPYFWLLMMKFKGQTPLYGKYFLTNHLHEYSRECI